MRIGLAVLATVGVAAVAYAASEFTPADYSPTETVAIRTLDIQRATSRSSTVLVGIANRQGGPVNVSFECSIFSSDGRPIASTFGNAQSVPPNQEVSSNSVSFEGTPDKVACRITRVVERN